MSFISTDMAFCRAWKLRVTSVSSATRSTTETFDCSSEPVRTAGVGHRRSARAVGAEQRAALAHQRAGVGELDDGELAGDDAVAR